MKRLICRIRDHDWSPWNPRHGRDRVRRRKCNRCGTRQVHSIISGTIKALPVAHRD